MKLNDIIYLLLIISLGLFIYYIILKCTLNTKLIDTFSGIAQCTGGSSYFSGRQCPKHLKHFWGHPNGIASGVCCNKYAMINIKKTNDDQCQVLGPGVRYYRRRKCPKEYEELSSAPNGLVGVCCKRKLLKKYPK
jgi:hypothetical protein